MCGYTLIQTARFGLFWQRVVRRARAGLKADAAAAALDPLQERGGGVILTGSLNHTVSDCAPRYSSAYASVWLCIGGDPFQCKSGARGKPLPHDKGHQVGRWSCSSQKNLLTHALCRPVLPDFVRNEAYSPSIMASWGHRLL